MLTDDATTNTATITPVSQPGLASRTYRADRPIVNPLGLDAEQSKAWAWAIACGVGFVLLAAGALDLGASEARLGLAAGGRIGPFGQVFGYWAPDLWLLPVLASQTWAFFEENGVPTSVAVRWPAAIAGMLAGMLLAARLMEISRPRAGIFVALCWCGSLAMIDRSSTTGLDLILGLMTVAALDRMLSRGSDWIAGLWAAAAFLSGGWPPLVVIGLAIIVIGRRSAGLSLRLALPPAIAIVAWSAWALRVAPVEAWASALTLPLTQKPSWTLAIGVFGIGLPWIVFAPIAPTSAVLGRCNPSTQAYVKAWLQIGLAAVIAGTLVPGLATASRLPALAGFLIASAAVLDIAWDGLLAGGARRTFFGMGLALVLAWLVIGLVSGLYLTFFVPYYRAIGIILLLGLIPVVSLGFFGFEYRDARQVLIALGILAVSIKVGYSGCYAPEWNYRLSQGPWGRALGQWILPRWPVYTFHDWSPDLAFAIGHPVRQLKSPQHLTFEDPNLSKFVLLLESEYQNWPSDAPALKKLSQFLDESGGVRVIARTQTGYLPQPFGTRNDDHDD
jgi:hypothetical protein